MTRTPIEQVLSMRTPIDFFLQNYWNEQEKVKEKLFSNQFIPVATPLQPPNIEKNKCVETRQPCISCALALSRNQKLLYFALGFFSGLIFLLLFIRLSKRNE